MTHRAPVPPAHIAVAAAASLFLLALLVAQLVFAVDSMRDRVERSDVVYALHTEIVTENQKQALALTLASTTGDVAWVLAHRRAAQRLEAAVQRLPGVVEDDELMPLAARAISAREGMILGENIANAAVRRGDLARAREVLADASYMQASLAFDAELVAILDTSRALISGAVVDGKTALQQAVVAVGAAILGLGAFWAWIVVRAGASVRQFARLVAELERAHAALAQRAQAREASLFDHSPTPVLERDARPLAAAFAELRARGVDDLAAELEADPGLHRRLYDLAVLSRANEPYFRLLGAATFEDFAVRRERALDTADFAHLRSFLVGAWGGATTLDEELTIRNEARPRVLRTVHRILRDADGAPVTVLTSTIDLTPEREMQNALAAARDAAEAASRAKSEFLATMSHEIRTPMNGVLGMASALRHTQLTPDQRGMLDVIEESGSALMVILNDILDISKIEAGHLDIAAEDFDITCLTQAVEALFTPRAAERRLTLTVDVAAGACGAWRSDPMRIRQMLANFLSNAIKFTHAGGVRLEVSTTDRDQLGADGAGPYLVFTVTDTGIGVPADRLAKLWAPFTQADSSTTREYGGTGLGLTIVKRLAEAMGGWVAARSTVGEGSSFTFAVAAARVSGEGKGEVSATAAETPPGAPSGLRVLAAEDVAQNRQVLQALLPALDPGVSLTFAHTGTEAVERFEDLVFDVVLMDMHMPVMDGLDAVRLIRAFEAKTGRAPTPIIALTANAGDVHVREALAAGCNAHVAKPIRPAELFGAILRHLAQAESKDQDEGEDESEDRAAAA